MVSFIIDGKNVEAEEGATVLQVARKNGIVIPTLCCHDSVAPSGACRLCVVEVKKGKRTRIVTSCLYPVDEGIVVETKTDRVMNVRRLVMQLLMARCPESEVIKDMAKEMGIEPEPAFHPDTDKGKCVLCRLCVKACEDVVGASAIGLFGRGKKKEVGPPFMEDSKACIGCGACAYVCPTGHIQMEATDGRRKIWGRTFKMQACEKCGRYFAPIDQLKFINEKTGTPMSELAICMSCK